MEHIKKFISEGVTELSTIFLCEEKDFEELGVSEDGRREIFARIEQITQAGVIEVDFLDSSMISLKEASERQSKLGFGLKKVNNIYARQSKKMKKEQS